MEKSPGNRCPRCFRDTLNVYYEEDSGFRLGAACHDPSEPLNNECKTFISSIKSGKPPISDGQDGWKVLRVMEAAQESIRGYGKPVNFQPPQAAKIK